MGGTGMRDNRVLRVSSAAGRCKVTPTWNHTGPSPFPARGPLVPSCLPSAPGTLAARLNLQRTPTHLNPFIAKLLFNNYITVPTVLHNEISMRDIRDNIKL